MKMVKKTHICDREIDGDLCSGKLEQIAETMKESGWSGSRQSSYLECGCCHQIYTLSFGILSGFTNTVTGEKTDPREYEDLIPYEGSLTKEQIIEHAPKTVGWISSRRENKIILGK